MHRISPAHCGCVVPPSSSSSPPLPCPALPPPPRGGFLAACMHVNVTCTLRPLYPGAAPRPDSELARLPPLAPSHWNDMDVRACSHRLGRRSVVEDYSLPSTYAFRAGICAFFCLSLAVLIVSRNYEQVPCPYSTPLALGDGAIRKGTLSVASCSSSPPSPRAFAPIKKPRTKKENKTTSPPEQKTAQHQQGHQGESRRGSVSSI